jgi:hypothetical protein
MDRSGRNHENGVTGHENLQLNFLVRHQQLRSLRKGEQISVYHHGWATCCIHVPIFENKLDIQNRMYLLVRKKLLEACDGSFIMRCFYGVSV